MHHIHRNIVEAYAKAGMAKSVSKAQPASDRYYEKSFRKVVNLQPHLAEANTPAEIRSDLDDVRRSLY